MASNDQGLFSILLIIKSLDGIFLNFQTIVDDINNQKSKARDLLSAAKRIRRESSIDEDPLIQEKLDALKQGGDSLAKLSADRLSTLEQAVPLSAHFNETHSELLTWFTEMDQEITALDEPALNTEEIKVKCVRSGNLI